MTTKADERIARIEAAIERLEALGLSAPVVSPASINPDGSPGHVAPGEIIESAWGNAVSDEFKRSRILVHHKTERTRTFTTTSTVPQMAFQTPTFTPRSTSARFVISVTVHIGASSVSDDVFVFVDRGPGAPVPGPTPPPGNSFGSFGYHRFVNNASGLEIGKVAFQADDLPNTVTPFSYRVALAVRTAGGTAYLNRRGQDDLVGTVSSITVLEMAS